MKNSLKKTIVIISSLILIGVPLLLIYGIWYVVFSESFQIKINKSLLNDLHEKFALIVHPENTYALSKVNQDIILYPGGSAYSCFYYVFEIRKYEGSFYKIIQEYKLKYPEYFNQKDFYSQKLIITNEYINKMENILFQPFSDTNGIPLIQLSTKEFLEEKSKDFYFIGYGFSKRHEDFSGAICKMNKNQEIKFEKYIINVN